MNHSIFRKKGKNPFTSILLLLGVRHTTGFAEKYFNEHPHKYNMYGLSKMLSSFGINNMGIKVKDKKLDIYSLEVPFVAYIGNDFVTVETINTSGVIYYWNSKRVKISIDEFINIWSGIVLLVEAEKSSIEPNYRDHKKKELITFIRKNLLLCALICLIMIGFFQNALFQNPGILLLLLINILGVYIGYILILNQINVHGSYADKICSLFKKSDCNNILESSAAKFLGFISWSELGISYFLSNVFVLIFVPKLFHYVILLNIPALFFSIWSFWYQKFKAKTWCPLCLIVLILFWASFLVDLLFSFIQIPKLAIIDILSVSLIYGIPLLIINLLLPILTQGQKLETITQEFNSLKVNEDLFLMLLSKQARYEVNRNVSNILLGNPNSKHMLTIFTNPHCEPCARMHKCVEELLNEVGDKFCIQYILSSFSESLDSSCEFFLYINNTRSAKDRDEIYSKWFEGGKYNKKYFFDKYDFVFETISEEHKLHKLWRKNNRLASTPTLLFNGIVLPQVYIHNISDLKYFVDLEID